MTFSMRRLSAILRKEVQDLKNNAQILLLALLPIGLAFFYKQLGSGKEMMGGIVVVMVMSMIVTIAQATLIAEEKEKHTLRVLMLSPASPIEVIVGKSLPIIILSIVLNFVSLFLLNVLQGSILLLSVIIVIGTLLFIILGTLVGLLAKSLVQVSVITTPISMILLMGPILNEVIKNEMIKKVVSYLPTNHIFEAIVSVVNGKGFSVIQTNLLNISIWLVITVIVCMFVYKKKQLD
ncbi:ABC transporter permease [Bacillus pseudomycoides]|uniref:ABC transporter permease n=1 Tax=Bacillus pseudomycoides TaxID=64104 RepID=UPI000BEB8DE3|nr:ABC transporter permease [Bacillus pseudomycoides]PEE41058.1 ABC transporter permease [Bacillus pseudomycoides]PGA89941.1 ABC transporter permease [Bacillus pseudomycoides]PHF43592.1 ABC transporter permease [Bacillus pseudomycoides]